MNEQDVWKIAYSQLELQFDRPTFETWLKGATLLRTEEEGRLYVVGVRNSMTRDMLQHRYYRNLRRVLSDASGADDVEIRFEVHTAQAVPEVKAEEEEAPLFRLLAQQDPTTITEPLHRMVQRPRRETLPESELSPRFTFERFILTDSNRIAYEAAQAVAEAPGRNYNPLFVYGGVGLGKTHLLQSIAHACQRKGVNALYIPSEVFTNDLVVSIRNKTTAMFREKYRGVDVLVVDDVQFIAGKDTTQEEFFHTFNALTTFNKQVVIASDRHPRELSLLEDRLRSRFQGGLVVDVQPIAYEGRVALVEMWAEEKALKLDAEIVGLLANSEQANVRELEGLFNQVVAHAQLSRGAITADGVRRTISQFKQPRHSVASASRRVTVDDVINTTARHFDIDIETITGKSRAKRVNTARQVAMYLAREMTGLSLPQIGGVLGGRRHTTIRHGANKIAESLAHDSGLRHSIEEIRDELGRR